MLCGRSFFAAHPITQLFLVDLDTLVSHQALVLFVQMLGSVWCSALYYYTSGVAQAPWSRSECVSFDLQSKLRIAIPVSIVSYLVALAPRLLIYNLIGARPRPAEQSRQRRIDAILFVLCYILGLGLCCFYLMYLAIFLANVHEDSAANWAMTAALMFMNSWLLFPLLQAVVSTVLTAILLWQDPSLPQRIFNLKSDEAEDTEKPQPVEEELQSERPLRERKAQKVSMLADACQILPGQVEDPQDFSQVLPVA